MKTNALIAVACAVALAGCDYTVSLTDAPELPIDKTLVGSWERTTQQGERQRLLVLPLGPNEYLVSFPAGAKDAMFARAALCKTGTLTLIQLAWFGTAQGATPEDGRIFQYASYTLADGTLKGRLLNADVVDRDVSSAAALSAAIEANRDNPKLFRDAWEFTRAEDPAKPGVSPKRPPIPAAWR